VPCLIATHYPELKAYAHSTPGAMNASMEFDLKSLKPTYHLIMGLPGRSNALAIAQRLGLSEEIIQDARQLIDPADLHAEDLLDEIHRQRDAARHDRSLAEAGLVEAEDLRTELEERLEKIEQERQLILEKARQEAEKELEQIRQELAETRLKMRGIRNASESIKPIKEKIEQLQEKTSKPVERLQPAGFVTQEPRPLRPGDRVHLYSLKVDGEVTGINGDEVEVLVGKMRIKVSPGDIQRSRFIPELATKIIQESAATKLPNAGHIPSPGVEVHLRGMRAEAAVEKLERYLDDAYAAGLPYVRVVHGKGTGTLRQVVRQMLGSSPLVKNWEIALDNEGGEGVTIAHLVTE
jgi:DNA mismatch repair protein MutS2